MADQPEIKSSVAWECKSPAPIACVAVSTRTGRVVVADQQGEVRILGQDGAVLCTIPSSPAPCAVAASADGKVFAALSGEGGLMVFGPDGKVMWAKKLGAGVLAVDLGISGQQAAVVKSPDKLVLVSGAAGVKELTCQHSVTTCAMFEGQTSGIVACGKDGALSFVTLEGVTKWHYAIGNPCGRVRVCQSAGLIAVPAMQGGLQAFKASGEGAGAFDLGQPVRAACPAVMAGKPCVALLTDEKSVTLLGLEGAVYWYEALAEPVQDMMITENGLFLVLQLGADKLVGVRLGGAGGQQQAAPQEDWNFESWEREPAAAGGPETPLPPGDADAQEEAPPPVAADEAPTPVDDEEEEAAPAAAPAAVAAPVGAEKPKQASVVWQAELPDAQSVESDDKLFISPQGNFVAVALPGGQALAFDAKGTEVASVQVGGAASLCKKFSESILGAWGPNVLAALTLEKGKGWTVALGPEKAKCVDCSVDLGLIAVVDVKDNLVLMKPDGKEIARREVKPGPQHLRTAPGGRTVLTEDEFHRLRFFSETGELRRKQRLAGGERFPQVVLEDGFCAFGGSKGRVVIQDMKGNVLWTEKVAENVARLESLQDVLAVYDVNGACFVVNPYGEVVTELQPPPGALRLRSPKNGDAVVLHARGNAITAYGGYQRKLKALWRFECKDPIQAFEVDQSAQFAVVAAGGKLYFIRRG